MSNQPGVGVRLFMAGAEIVKQSFSQIGDAGRRMWAAIAAGEESANPALKGLSAASREAKGFMGDLAQNAGVAGRVLSSMGPAGFAAAAGIGAVVLALGQLAQRSVAALERLDDIGDAAGRLDVGVDMLIRYGVALEAAGGKQAELVSGLESFQEKAGSFLAGVSKEGSGFGKALDALGISRADLESAGSMEAQLRLIADALVLVGDRAEQAGIADKLGLSTLLPLLVRGSDGIDDLSESSRDLATAGAQAAAELGPLADRMAAANLRIETATDLITSGLAPALVGLKELLADVLGGIAGLGESGGTIDQQIARLKARIEELKPDAEGNPDFISVDILGDGSNALRAGDPLGLFGRSQGAAAAEIARSKLQLQLLEFTRSMGILAGRGSAPKPALNDEAEGDVSGDVAGLEDKFKARADAAKTAASAFAEATRTLDAALEKARGPLGSYLADLDELAKASAALPGRQAEVAEATLGASRTYLEAAAKAADLNDGLEALEKRDPGAIDQYAARLAELAAQRNDYPGGSEAFQAALDAETRAFLDAAQGADRATKSRKAFEDLWKELATPKERAGAQRAADIKIVNQALADGETTADRAAEALRRIEERYDGVSAAQIKAAETGEGWITLLKGLEDGAASFEDTLVSLIERIIELTLLDFFKGSNKGDLWGSFTGALDDLFGFGGGGGGGGGGSVGFDTLGGFWHGGGGPGDRPAFRRTLPASLWADAPRRHDGHIPGLLGRRERAVIVNEDESTLTPGQLGELYKMGMGHGRSETAGMAGKLLITLRDESGGRLQAEQSEGQEGPELDILVRDSVASNINSGGLDSAMRNRFGLTPRPT